MSDHFTSHFFILILVLKPFRKCVFKAAHEVHGNRDLEGPRALRRNTETELDEKHPPNENQSKLFLIRISWTVVTIKESQFQEYLSFPSQTLVYAFMARLAGGWCQTS